MEIDSIWLTPWRFSSSNADSKSSMTNHDGQKPAGPTRHQQALRVGQHGQPKHPRQRECLASTQLNSRHLAMAGPQGGVIRLTHVFSTALQVNQLVGSWSLLLRVWGPCAPWSR
jgi:hypothetical protein